MSTFAPTYNPAIPYGEYVPWVAPDDRDRMRSLEEEILWQWIEQDSVDLPPPEIGATAESVAGDLGWRPMSAAQEMALECEADILLYGGAAGSLKSETLLVRAGVEVGNPNYNGILFRQSFPELRDLVVKSLKLYPRLGGRFTKGSPMCWTFPSGATIWLGYMAADDDVFAHQGQEYSFIGFDEGGHQNEHRIRYMLTRLRSTDQTLRLALWITANPGGPGHSFLMKMFLRGVCPHCEPHRAVKAGHLYFDAVWPSDGQSVSVTLPNGNKVMKSVAFIPGKVTDHGLLGDAYVANLMMQASSTAKKLLDGCWKEWEGQFFDCFSEIRGIIMHADGTFTVPQPDMRMVVPVQELDIKYWYPHGVGGDYGFSISSAAAHLFVRLPPSERFKNGRIAIIDEYLKPGVTAKDYGRDLAERWFLEPNPDRPGEMRVPERPRAIHMWAVSPDAFRKDGSVNDVDVTFSRLEQMNESLAPYGMGFVRANDDRAGGWMKVYQMLRDGELIVGKHCVNTIEALQTRLRDPKKYDDVLKVSGDPLDDACLVAETMVLTERGEVSLGSVTTVDRVWTRSGWKRVIASRMTNASATVFTVTMSEGTTLTGTANHPVFVQDKGFTHIDSLRYGDMMEAWKAPTDSPKSSRFRRRFAGWNTSPSTVSCSAGIRTRQRRSTEPTTLQGSTNVGPGWARYIRKSGNMLTGQSQLGSTSTTSTAMPTTTGLRTLSAKRGLNTSRTTIRRDWRTRFTARSSERILTASGQRQRLGTLALKDSRGTQRTAARHGTIGLRSTRRVTSVAPDSHLSREERTTGFALTDASQHGGGDPDSTTFNEYARSVVGRSRAISTATRDSVPVYVLGIVATGSAAVYNLEVEGSHEFYANGILTHNCDSLRYAVMTWPMYAAKPREERLAEAVQGLDPTNAMLTARKFELEERRTTEMYSPKAIRGGTRKPW